MTHSGEASVLDVASEVHLETTPVSFSVGDKFPSFEQLEAKIKTYEEQNYVKLWKRDCRTIEAARKRMNRSLSENIKYYEVIYCCIHGGKKFKGRGEGKCSSMYKQIRKQILFYMYMYLLSDQQRESKSSVCW